MRPLLVLQKFVTLNLTLENKEQGTFISLSSPSSATQSSGKAWANLKKEPVTFWNRKDQRPLPCPNFLPQKSRQVKTRVEREGAVSKTKAKSGCHLYFLSHMAWWSRKCAWWTSTYRSTINWVPNSPFWNPSLHLCQGHASHWLLPANGLFLEDTELLFWLILVQELP